MKRKYYSNRISPKQYPTVLLILVMGGILGIQGLKAISSRITSNFLYENSEQASRATIDHINTIRMQHGRKPIAFDSRAFQLATARAEDMLKHRYYDHTNPATGSCADNTKVNYGIQANEYVAENILQYGDTNALPLGNSLLHPMTDSIQPWMESRGHRYNLMYSNHVAGAVACIGDKCVFLGLNYDRFGAGCYTAEEGLRHWQTVPPQPGEVLTD